MNQLLLNIQNLEKTLHHHRANEAYRASAVTQVQQWQAPDFSSFPSHGHGPPPGLDRSDLNFQAARASLAND
ncbi:unnamed protein product, partial [Symbiodinium natans]